MPATALPAAQAAHSPAAGSTAPARGHAPGGQNPTRTGSAGLTPFMAL